jgi:hypothetical protein
MAHFRRQTEAMTGLREFKRDATVKAQVERFIHHTHSAPAEELLDLLPPVEAADKSPPVVIRVVDQGVGLAGLGDLVGTAFQISDDIIDIDSDPDESGKLPGTDLRQGVRTLPVLYALRSAGQSSTDVRLRWLLDEADLTDEALVAEALTLLRGHHAMKESRADVLNWLHEARVSISTLPDGPARAAFLALCDFVEKRTG